LKKMRAAMEKRESASVEDGNPRAVAVRNDESTPRKQDGFGDRHARILRT